MLTRPETTTKAGERPFNNLLRRLSDSDYALLTPHLLKLTRWMADYYPAAPASSPTWLPTRTAAMSRPS